MSEALEGYEDEARRSPERVSWRATIVRGNIMFRVVYCTGDTMYGGAESRRSCEGKGVRRREWGGWWAGRAEESEGDEEVARRKKKKKE